MKISVTNPDSEDIIYVKVDGRIISKRPFVVGCDGRVEAQEFASELAGDPALAKTFYDDESL